MRNDATDTMKLTRRETVLGVAAFAAAPPRLAGSTERPKVTVTKDPNCGCCSGWVEHLHQHGFSVDVADVPEINRVKSRLGIPQDLWACHTGEGAGYIMEGHVPAPVILRLLQEKSAAMGLAVPGMPAGSPGMEVEGSSPAEYPEYDVVLFGPAGRRTYARCKGAQELRV